MPRTQHYNHQITAVPELTPRPHRVRERHWKQEVLPVVLEISENGQVRRICPQEYPCGGHVPEPPENCRHLRSASPCGRPCVDIAVCAYVCSSNNKCPAYVNVHILLKKRRTEDAEKSKTKPE